MTIRELIRGLQAIADKHGDGVEPCVLVERTWLDVSKVSFKVDDNGGDDIARCAVIEFSRVFGHHEIEVTTKLKEVGK